MDLIACFLGKGLGEDQEMRSNTVRDKHLRVNQAKLTRLKKILGAATETEAIDKAMDYLLAEDEILKVLRRAKGKGRIKRIFV